MEIGQVNGILKKLIDFSICLSIDHLYQYKPSDRRVFIVLIDSTKVLGHFVLIFTKINGSIILFDPVGTNHVHPKIKKWLKDRI